MQVSVKNEEPAGAASLLSVEVVTVGDASVDAERRIVAPQESVTVPVHRGQFLMLEEKEGS